MRHLRLFLSIVPVALGAALILAAHDEQPVAVVLAGHSGLPCSASTISLASMSLTRATAQARISDSVSFDIVTPVSFFCPVAVIPNGSQLFGA